MEIEKIAQYKHEEEAHDTFLRTCIEGSINGKLSKVNCELGDTYCTLSSVTTNKHGFGYHKDIDIDMSNLICTLQYLSLKSIGLELDDIKMVAKKLSSLQPVRIMWKKRVLYEFIKGVEN